MKVLSEMVVIGLTKQVRLNSLKEGRRDWPSGHVKGESPGQRTKSKGSKAGWTGGGGHRKRGRSKDRGNTGQMGLRPNPERRRQTEASSLNPLIRDSGESPLN